MIHDISSMKPILLVDVAMNNYAMLVFNKMLKHDKELPSGFRNDYFIYQYKDLQARYFKRFYRICDMASRMTDDDTMEELSYRIMDEFEATIKPSLDKLEQELQLFILQDMGDPENAILLRKIQINSVLLQIAQILNVYYIQKKDSLVTRMMEINTLMTEKIDDRTTKREYESEELNKAKQELVNAVKEFKFESREQTEMENLQPGYLAERRADVLWSIPDGKRTVSTKQTTALPFHKGICKQWWHNGRRSYQGA